MVRHADLQSAELPKHHPTAPPNLPIGPYREGDDADALWFTTEENARWARR
jgi:hypothetical protein